MTKLRKPAASERGIWRVGLVPLLGLLLTASLSLASCSSGDDDAAAATAQDDAAGGDSEQGDRASREEQTLDFYQCLRDGGIDVEDPDEPGMIKLEGIDPDNPQHKQIVEDCGTKHLPNGGPGNRPELDAEALESLADFTACMRDEGIDMPDPAADGSLSIGDADPESAEFQAAMEECRDLMAGVPLMMTR